MNIVEIDGVEYVTAEDFRELEKVHNMRNRMYEQLLEDHDILEDDLEKLTQAINELWRMV